MYTHTLSLSHTHTQGEWINALDVQGVTGALSLKEQVYFYFFLGLFFFFTKDVQGVTGALSLKEQVYFCFFLGLFFLFFAHPLDVQGVTSALSLIEQVLLTCC
jgi:hypothetical protein